MILQGFYIAMLTIKHIMKLYALVFTALTAALTFALYATLAHAEANQSYKQEPITPIPQTIEVNKAKAKLGETLFFDTRLSKGDTISCATCHQLEAGGDDNVAMGISLVSDKHVINTPTIFNARYNFRQNWDGSAKTLGEQIEMVMANHHEFNNQWDNIIAKLTQDKKFNNDFVATYKEGITRKNITDAIVEYEKTLITPNSRFDNYLRNTGESLTETEIEGYELFKELGCISCHQGVNVGGNLFQKFGIFYDYLAERGNINRQDYGKFNVTNRQIDKFVFKVPSLRNVAVTAPYLHDGSAQTIEEAISIMGKTQIGRTLTDKEISLIKSFLYTLTGEYKNKSLDKTS